MQEEATNDACMAMNARHTQCSATVSRSVDPTVREKELEDCGMTVGACVHERRVVSRSGVDARIGKEQTNDIGVAISASDSHTVVFTHARVNAAVTKQATHDACMAELTGNAQGRVLIRSWIDARIRE